MLDVGFWEVALIAIITLLVVGPERMPAVARTIGAYVRKIKKFVHQVQHDVTHEIEAEQIRKHLSAEDETAGVVEVLKDLKDDTEQGLKKASDKIDKAQ